MIVLRACRPPFLLFGAHHRACPSDCEGFLAAVSFGSRDDSQRRPGDYLRAIFAARAEKSRLIATPPDGSRCKFGRRAEGQCATSDAAECASNSMVLAQLWQSIFQRSPLGFGATIVMTSKEIRPARCLNIGGPLVFVGTWEKWNLSGQNTTKTDGQVSRRLLRREALLLILKEVMVGPAGLEPATLSLEG